MINSKRSNFKAEGTVLGITDDHIITVVFRHVEGVMDGGRRVVPIDLIPPSLRMPNSKIVALIQNNPFKVLEVK